MGAEQGGGSVPVPVPVSGPQSRRRNSGQRRRFLPICNGGEAWVLDWGGGWVGGRVRLGCVCVVWVGGCVGCVCVFGVWVGVGWRFRAFVCVYLILGCVNRRRLTIGFTVGTG